MRREARFNYRDGRVHRLPCGAFLLYKGFDVHGYDGMTDYCRVPLKRRRYQMLLQNRPYTAIEGMFEDSENLWSMAEGVHPDVIVPSPLKAAVRYSLENARFC